MNPGGDGVRGPFFENIDGEEYYGKREKRCTP